MAKKQAETPPPPGYDWGQVENTGLENARPEDFGVPFLILVQKGSPEFDKTHAKYAEKHIEGVQPGDVVNTSSRQILAAENESLEVIPVYYVKQYVEWKPRTQGGGMVTVHSDATILAQCKRNEKGQDILPNGNNVVTTAYFHVLASNGGEWAPAVIGLSSTQLKSARQWLNLISGNKRNGRVLPMFSCTYLLSTRIESNTKGSWYGWNVERGSIIEDAELATRAIEANTSASTQIVRAIGAGGDDDSVPM